MPRACHSYRPNVAREVLAASVVASPLALLGLYHGNNLMQNSAFDLPSLPCDAIPYRDLIMACSRATGRSLNEMVTHVLIQEIGQYLGFSNADKELIEQS